MSQNNTTGSICAEEYTVKRGDSFYLIAHKLGVPLRDLLAANRDIHPARLMVGDVLCIPREEDDSPSTGGLTGGGATGGTTGSGTTGGTAGGTVNGATGSGTTGGTANGTTGSGTTNGTIGSGTANGTTNGTNGSGTTGGTTNGTTGSGGTIGGTTNGTTGSGTTGGTTNGTTGNSGTTGGTANGTNGSGTTGGTTGNGGTTGSVTDNCAQTGTCPPSEPAPNCPLDEQLIIQRGQTVADVQILNLLSRNTLQVANPDVDLDALRVGQTICVPPENVPCALPSTYTLTTSETLEAVAVRFNLPVASILRANPCLAPQDFEAGVTVVLPR